MMFSRSKPSAKRTLLENSFGYRTTSARYPSKADAPDAVLIIGVVGHVRHWGLAADDQSALRAQFYYPFAQVADQLLPRWSQLMSLAVQH